MSDQETKILDKLNHLDVLKLIYFVDLFYNDMISYLLENYNEKIDPIFILKKSKEI